jgi:hypothetical protein
VAALLGELESAAEARDAERLAARLAPDFEGKHAIGRDEAVAQARRYFAVYESLSLSVYDVEVEDGDAGAHVRCTVEMSGSARPIPGLGSLLPPSAVYRFELDVVPGPGPTGDAWLVRGASWEPVTPD